MSLKRPVFRTKSKYQHRVQNGVRVSEEVKAARDKEKFQQQNGEKHPSSIRAELR